MILEWWYRSDEVGHYSYNHLHNILFIFPSQLTKLSPITFLALKPEKVAWFNKNLNTATRSSTRHRNTVLPYPFNKNLDAHPNKTFYSPLHFDSWRSDGFSSWIGSAILGISIWLLDLLFSIWEKRSRVCEGWNYWYIAASFLFFIWWWLLAPDIWLLLTSI